jgi:hypothetical protein
MVARVPMVNEFGTMVSGACADMIGDVNELFRLMSGDGTMTARQSRDTMRACNTAGYIHPVYAQYADCGYGLEGGWASYGCGQTFRREAGDLIAGESAFQEVQRAAARLLRCHMIGRNHASCSVPYAF